MGMHIHTHVHVPPIHTNTRHLMLCYSWRPLLGSELLLLVFLWEITSQSYCPTLYVWVSYWVWTLTCTICALFRIKSENSPSQQCFQHALITTNTFVSEFFRLCHSDFSYLYILHPSIICFVASDNGYHCCVDVVDTSAVRGQRLVPKNTRPLAFLLIVASHGTVLSEPASEQQAGHSIPLFSAYTFVFTEPETHTHTGGC